VNCSGLVLAAGAGTRFGPSPKLLACLGGRPILEHAVAAACAVDELERVVIVLGAHAARLQAVVDFGRAEPVVCDHWGDGISASLRAGIAALAGADRVIVTLGDAPDVTPAVIARFLAAPDGARATYGGRPGHPVVLGPAQLAGVPGLSGDEGARRLLAQAPEIECSDLAAGRDVDTAADLEEARRAAAAAV
jgi:molybdenum cofactor cytidylyltransferase